MVGKCRFCGAPLKQSFIDLGMSPLSNAFLKEEQLSHMEPFYPLHAYVCQKCLLVQLEECEAPENIFSDYVYFSSFSEGWLKHSLDYTKAMIARFGLNKKSQVIEIASNDGYLLQYFKEASVPVLGIEPAANVAEVAKKKDIPTLVEFFGTKLAKKLSDKGTCADLLLGNNVLAHVPDLNDFVAGMKIILKKQGVITMEFPHLLQLIEHRQFDTIYHEHFSYFSFLVVEKVFAKHGLKVFDVEEIPTHGGSLRVYACHAEDNTKPVENRVEKLKHKERRKDLDKLDGYSRFDKKVVSIKTRLLEFLIQTKMEGKKVVAYGAAAKGNTLLNYCGIRTDMLEYTVDRSPHKQGLFLPGTHIPVYAPDMMKETKPHYVLILPWNLKDEIMEQMAHIRKWHGKFVVAIPNLEVMA